MNKFQVAMTGLDMMFRSWAGTWAATWLWFFTLAILFGVTDLTLLLFVPLLWVAWAVALDKEARCSLLSYSSH